jgi:hypothetical protein
MPTITTPLKTLFLNPPSFENFDGGASSRWPATREIESYWYPVWLAYPAGLLEGSRLLDAPPHHVSGHRNHRDLQGIRVPRPLHLDRRLGGRSAPRRSHQGCQSVDQDRLRRPAGDHLPGQGSERVPARSTSSAAASSTTRSSSLRRASRSARSSASATRQRQGRAQSRPPAD